MYLYLSLVELEMNGRQRSMCLHEARYASGSKYSLLEMSNAKSSMPPLSGAVALVSVPKRNVRPDDLMVAPTGACV